MRFTERLSSGFRDIVWTQLSKRTPEENAFLVLIPTVGAVTGAAALLIAHLISLLQGTFWRGSTNLLDAALAMPWYARILIPTLGGVLVGLLAKLAKLQTRSGGTAGLIQALALKSGFVSLREKLPETANGILTVSCGGSLGREGPMIEFAAAVTSRLARQCRLTTQHVRILVCCAIAAAVAAVYNAPIGGTIFVMEIIIGNFALEIFGPVVIASVISTLIFRSATSNIARFVIPQYELVSGWELFNYLALGVIAGVFSVLFIKLIFWAQDAFESVRVPGYCKPAIGFALVGIIGVWYPHVFGNGYESVNLVLHEQLPWQLLVILPFAKIIAVAITRGAGGAGGVFTPTLMVGALVGGAFGYGVHNLFPLHTAEYGAYALVGMGAVLAGTTHAPIMAILMIFEQTNSYQIILPLMFVCIISNVTARALKRESLHLEALKRRGVKLPSGPEAGVMQTLRVEDVMHDDVSSINHLAAFPAVVESFLKEPHNNLYVVDGKGCFLGAIRLHSLKDLLHQTESLTSVIAHDLVDESFQFVTPRQKLADAMEIFWRENAERLPVINHPGQRTLVGWISKRDLLGVYSQEILRKRQLLSHFVVRDGSETRDMFVEMPEGFELRTVEVPAHLAGRTLVELGPRSNYNVHVLVVKRRDLLTGRVLTESPTPTMRLALGDDLVVIGKFENIAQFMSALATGVEKEQA